MRGKRKSESVNRTEHEAYAFYPLPQHTTNLEEAVAWVAAGRGLTHSRGGPGHGTLR